MLIIAAQKLIAAMLVKGFANRHKILVNAAQVMPDLQRISKRGGFLGHPKETVIIIILLRVYLTAGS